MTGDGVASVEVGATGDDRATRLAPLRDLVEQIRPVTLAHERALPVVPAVEQLLPARGLQRGSTVSVAGGSGTTALAFAVLAGPTRAGSWAACVGLPELGWAAAAQLGVDLERVVVVRPPAAAWATVVAALVDAFDVVVCGPEHAPTAAEVRRLSARARERGAVLMAVGGAVAAGLGRSGSGRARRAWVGSDVRLAVGAAQWSGPGEGWGHLRSRRVSVTVQGRGGMARPRRSDLWLPGPDGTVSVVAGASSGDVAPGDVAPGDVVSGDVAPGGAAVVPLRRRAG